MGYCYRLGHPAVEVLAQVPRLMYSQATVRSYTKDRAVLRWDHTLKRGRYKVVSVNQSNTTEILHVGTFAGHIGHRPLHVLCGEKRVLPQGAPFVGAQRYQGYMTGCGLEVKWMTRCCLPLKDTSDTSFFPTMTSLPGLFLITSLHDAWQAVASTCPPPFHPMLFAKNIQGTGRELRRRKVTRQLPVAKFSHRQASKRKLPGYINRIHKRARLCNR